MDKYVKENPFIIDPIVGLYLLGFFFLWYINFRDKRPSIDFKLVDRFLVLGMILFYFFHGIYK